MKRILLVFIVITGALLTSCKKEKASSQTLTGKWELRNVLGGQVAGAPSTFKAGNGQTVEFSAKEYVRAKNGNVSYKANYTIVDASADIDGVSYNKAIVNDNNGSKLYYKISGSKLMLSMGSVAVDGFTETYEKL